MNNEKLCRKAFEAEVLRENLGDLTHDKDAPEEYAEDDTQLIWIGFQVCWQLFTKHIEILPDDAKPQEGDLCLFTIKARSGTYQHICEWSNYEPEDESFSYSVDKIITRNGKPCIKAKDLMGE